MYIVFDMREGDRFHILCETPFIDGVKIENGHLELSPSKVGLGLNLKQKKFGLF